MANRASGGADRAGGADPFPWVVSLGCLIVGLALFLRSTIPALAEQRELEKVERDLARQTAETEREVREIHRRSTGIGSDPELLRVLLDERRLTPQEAIDLVGSDGATPGSAPDREVAGSGPGATAERSGFIDR